MTRKPKTSKYTGVSRNNITTKFVAQCKKNGITTYLGSFDVEEDAARAYDQHLYRQMLDTNCVDINKLNFGIPEMSNYKPFEKKSLSWKIKESNGKNACRFRGVSWYEHRKHWKANIQVGRKKIFLGRFTTAEDAARAYNKKAIELSQLKRCYPVPDTKTTSPVSKKVCLTVMEIDQTSTSPFDGLFFLSSNSPDSFAGMNIQTPSPNNSLSSSPRLLF